MKSTALSKNRGPGPSSGWIPTAPILGESAIMLGDWGDIWYTDYRFQVQPSTHYGDQFSQHINKKWLGDTSVADALPIHINLFMTELAESGYGMPQIHKCRAMLIQQFDAAEDNGLVSGNPAQRGKIINDPEGFLSEPRYEKDVFTDEKVEMLHRELPDDLMGNSTRLLLDTNLRGLELIARLGGHSNISETDVYAHTFLKALVDIVSVLHKKRRIVLPHDFSHNKQKE